ncbi:MAG: glycosyltransferase [Pseudomonadota bacterium]
MKILFVGETFVGSRSPQRVRALGDLGHAVTTVGTAAPGWSYASRPQLLDRVLYRLRLPLDRAAAGAGMARAAPGHDAVILDNARMIAPKWLRAARRAAPDARFIWFSEDDMMNPIHRTRWLERSLGLFDLCVTTKSFNADPGELPVLGARAVLFVNNSYCPHEHRPIGIDADERRRWGAPASFVGTFEAPRARSLVALARAGVAVRVWGNGWSALRGTHPLLSIEDRLVHGDDYRRVVAASAINLCFLRHANRDRQTCRSIEIPAMGGFMIHEHSEEMSALFAPDREVVYFRDTDDLIARCRSWLDDPARPAVAAAGHARVRSGDFSHGACWRRILERAAGKT